MKKHTFVSALCGTVWCVLLTATTALAQGSPGSGGPTPDPTDPTEIPVDAGASFLLASGVALGLKKLRDRRRAH